MTSNQRVILSGLLMTLSLVTTPEQIGPIWSSLQTLSKQFGIEIGSRPTSVSQARATANSLRSRYLS